jgi:hypothetical protein
MLIEHTLRDWRYPDDVKALYYLYDIFRQSEEVGEDGNYKRIVPEPIRFARYLLDNPEKLKECGEIAKQAEKLACEKLGRK